jgi:hypothetical protein
VSGQARYRVGSVLAEEFSGFLVDEMKPGAGEANDGRIGIGIGLVLRRGLRKPMLHVRAQPWAFEKDMSAHRRNMPNPRAGHLRVFAQLEGSGQGKCGAGDWRDFVGKGPIGAGVMPKRDHSTKATGEARSSWRLPRAEEKDWRE